MMNIKMRIVLVAPCILAVMAVVSTVRADDSSTIADLFYDPITGNVRVSAKEAAGGKITSFQFENAMGTFIPGNYIGPTGGTFGTPVAEDGYEDVTTKVIADSDLTFVGFTGMHDFGNVFPAGMDLAQLDAYLTVAVYTGARGSGQKDIDMLLLPYLPDANGDEVVDAADYIILKQNFGMPGALWSDGDFDNSGTVDWDDLQILMAEFGTRSVGGAPAAPEPGSVMLLMFGAAALLRRRRKA